MIIITRCTIGNEEEEGGGEREEKDEDVHRIVKSSLLIRERLREERMDGS